MDRGGEPHAGLAMKDFAARVTYQAQSGLPRKCRSGASRTRTHTIASDGYQGEPKEGFVLILCTAPAAPIAA